MHQPPERSPPQPLLKLETNSKYLVPQHRRFSGLAGQRGVPGTGRRDLTSYAEASGSVSRHPEDGSASRWGLRQGQVPSPFAITTATQNIYGSVWASEGRLLALRFNDNDTPRDLTARTNLSIARQYGLESHGKLDVQIPDRRGLLQPGQHVAIRGGANSVQLEAVLDQKELALVESAVE